jgi:hypothetical protein
MAIKIAVDDGYGNVKVAIRHENGKISTHMVPTHFIPGAHAGNMNPLDGTFDTMVMRSGDQLFTVGDANRHGATEFENFSLHAANRAVVRFAIAQAGIADDAEYELAVGLPIGQYFAGDAYNDPLIAAKEKHHLTPVSRVTATETVLSAPTSVRCFPQSALVAMMAMDEDLDTFAVVDIGHRTTDVTVLSGGRVAFGRCGGLMDQGVSYAQKNFRRAIESRFKMNFETSFEKAFRSKEVRVSGTRYDVTEEWHTAVSTTAETIRQAVEEIVRPVRDLDQILLIGGGGHVFYDVLAANWPQLQRHDDPLFANATAWLDALGD